MANDLTQLYQFLKYSREHVKDEVSKNPWRLLYGSVDPASTWAWNQVTGRDDKPLINALGSPMGGGSAGLSHEGGVYSDARRDGLTRGEVAQGQTFFGIGDAIAGYYGGGALLEGVGAGAAGGGEAAGEMGVAGGAGDSLMGWGAGADVGGSAAGGSMSTYGSGAANAAGGLLSSSQPQGHGQPAPQLQQPDIQAQQAASIRMQEQLQLQALRQKPNKTMEDYMQLKKLTQNQGLLGQT